MQDRDKVDAIKRDYREAELDAVDVAMLDYVRRLTGRPATVEAADVGRLRRRGVGDKAILEINQIAGFFAWCNRTVEGLGVELETFWDSPAATNV